MDIDKDHVTVYPGSSPKVSSRAAQFVNDDGEFSLEVGDQVKVAMETVDDGFGETRLSREKARRAESWQMLEQAFEHNEVVKGLLNAR